MNRNYLRLFTIIFFFSSVASAQFPGQIIITEFMADPAAVTDASGEWFEIVNVSSQQIDLNGWHIKDNGTNNHTISGPLIMNPGAVFVLGNNSDSASNGGINIDYEYSSFTLTNSGDEIILTDFGGVVIDSVTYTSTTAGKSWNLDPSHFNAIDNDNFSYWCLSTTAYGLGDFGTPGPSANNISCVSGIFSFSRGNRFSIRTIGNELLIEWNDLGGKRDWNVVDLSGRTILSGTVSEKTSSMSVPLTGLAAGIYSFRFAGKSSAVKFMVH